MEHLEEALCAYALGPRPPNDTVRQLMGSSRPEVELDRYLTCLSTARRSQARRSARAIRMLDLQVIAPWDFPKRLRLMGQPPLALFVRGASATLYGGGQAIVGSRKASPGPLAWASERSKDAVRAQDAVISGGALGIDSEAHRVCTEAGGVGLVVLGVAVDRIYPAAHRSLFSQIVRHGGAIVSEHPPLAPTQAFHHATRNRLIAAICDQLWIAEAGENSGTLHTARAALKLGVSIGVPAEHIGGERAGIEWVLRQDGNVSVV